MRACTYDWRRGSGTLRGLRGNLQHGTYRTATVFRVFGRRLSSGSHGVESHDVRCGSSGSVTVDILNSHHLTSSTQPLVIYLPPTGTHLRENHPSIPSNLLKYSLATVKYRWHHHPSFSTRSSSPSSSFTTIPTSHPFPTPLHDTLHAFTWLTNHYLPSFDSRFASSKTNRNEFDQEKWKGNVYKRPPSSAVKVQTRPLIVYGSHLGGTIATSLALTECKASNNSPSRISALIVKDGIFDWTHIATSAPSSKPSSSSPQVEHNNLNLSTPWTSQTLHSLLPTLFSSPASTFDNFASPLLFFRTPGLAVPTSRFFPGHEPPPTPSNTNTDIEGLSLSDAEYAALSSAEHDILPSSTPMSDTGSGKAGGEMATQEVLRSSHLKFPPRDSGLKIPRSLFLCSRGIASDGSEGARSSEGEEDPAEQAAEMAGVMRRSVLVHELKERREWDDDLDAHGVADDRVGLVSIDGSTAGDEDAVVREWLDDIGL